MYKNSCMKPCHHQLSFFDSDIRLLVHLGHFLLTLNIRTYVLSFVYAILGFLLVIVNNHICIIFHVRKIHKLLRI